LLKSWFYTNEMWKYDLSRGACDLSQFGISTKIRTAQRLLRSSPTMSLPFDTLEPRGPTARLTPTGFLDYLDQEAPSMHLKLRPRTADNKPGADLFISRDLPLILLTFYILANMPIAFKMWLSIIELLIFTSLGVVIVVYSIAALNLPGTKTAGILTLIVDISFPLLLY
jgi:hypothetical protein